MAGRKSRISRRDFFRHGTAAGLGLALSPSLSLKEAKAQIKAKAKIPADLRCDPHYTEIREYLVKILGDLRTTGARRVVCRINKSDIDEPAPVFAGIVEVEDNEVRVRRAKKNQPDQGLYRFTDDNPSVVYNETVSKSKPGQVVWRDWREQLPEKQHGKRYHSAKALCYLQSGLRYQSFLAIRVGGRFVGTVTLAFPEAPKGKVKTEVEQKMKKWAQTDSPLVEYLQSTFRLGGPTF